LKPFQSQNHNGRNAMYIGLGGLLILILVLWLLGVI
jgi:CHASE1-domain containing sensor protein